MLLSTATDGPCLRLQPSSHNGAIANDCLSLRGNEGNENGGPTVNTNIASVPRKVAPRLASNQSSDATKQTLDTDLIRRIALGNKLALQVLYLRRNVRLFRFALRFVHNKDAAEDVVQEVLLDVWRKADEFNGRSQVSTWLLAIVRNKALTLLRYRSADQLDEDKAACIPDSADTPEMATRKEQARSITCKCLRNCPQRIAKSSISSTTTEHQSKMSRGSLEFQ
jgi:RNA polymerase sigma factor (sigma-70 family)